jgi:hypothetical protein
MYKLHEDVLMVHLVSRPDNAGEESGIDIISNIPINIACQRFVRKRLISGQSLTVTNLI